MDADLTLWKEFGLAGMVIGSLFTGIYFVIKWIFSFITRIADQHLDERSEWRKFTDDTKSEHRVERREWLDEFKSISAMNREGLDRVCDTLSNQITSLALHDIGRDKRVQRIKDDE